MLEGLEPKKSDALCVVGKEAAKLDKEDLKIFLDAMADPRWTTNALSDALAERGFGARRNSIMRHRANKCSCAR
jgi:hypothetical protein